MNKLINKILKEVEEMNDDSFFQPKNIEKREKERRKKILSQIRVGLKNIKVAYENKEWESDEEKLFLQMFSKIHVEKKYNESWDGYRLQEDGDRKTCAFDLEDNVFWISDYDVWITFNNKFDWGDDEVQLFMEQMLKKYFKLYEFTPSYP